MLRALLILFVSLLCAGRSAAQGTEEIVGYNYTCNGKAPSAPGSLSGHLVVNEDGTRDSFFAQFYPARANPDDPIYWGEARTLRRLGREVYTKWSIRWMEHGSRVRMAFDGGDLRLDISTQRRLPLHNMLVVGRSDILSTALLSSSDRWPGRQNGAEFSLRLSELFGFAGQDRSLSWRLYPAPLPHDWKHAYPKQRASGELDVAAPRAVAAAFEQLRAELLAKEAAFKTSCARQPVYYNPDAHISGRAMPSAPVGAMRPARI